MATRKEIHKKHSQTDKYKQTQLRYRKGTSRNKYLIMCAKRRAKKKGIEFNLEPTDIQIPEYCPLLNIKIDDWSEDSGYRSTLDRINNSLGYVKGNVMVVSSRANRLKNDATIAELELLIANMKKQVN